MAVETVREMPSHVSDSPDQDGEFAGEGSLVVEQRFAIVPEWVLDAGVSDVAFRLYVVLLRYGQSSGQRMPGRKLLAARLHKRSTDTVDRALKELVAVGAVVVERRRTGRTNLTNRYHVMTSPPSRPGKPGRGRNASGDCADPGSSSSASDPANSSAAPEPGGRRGAATPGRSDAAGLAAGERPDPGASTQENPPPSPPPTALTDPTRALGVGAGGDRNPTARVLAVLGLDNLDGVAEECRAARRRLGLPAARWTARALAEVLSEAVLVRGWPADDAIAALLAVAADPATRSPARLACPGPWWDIAEAKRLRGAVNADPAIAAELARLETRLVEADGARVWAQRQARDHLARSGEPVTRLAVARLSCRLLDEPGDNAEATAEVAQ